MNNRIKELEKLATEVEHSHGAFGEYEKHYSLNIEKFAELIIKECTELTLDYKNDEHYNGWLDFRDKIKEHFGVKQ